MTIDFKTNAARVSRKVRSFVRRWMCRRHVCDLSTLHRLPDEHVEATCAKCGAVLSGPYGLALPCAWTNTPNNAITSLDH